MQFREKVVVVTGGASGIGRALVHAFAREGAIVAVVDLRGSDAVTQHLNRRFPSVDTDHKNNKPHHKRHLAFTCDVTNAEFVQNMIQQIKSHYGRIDIYCSNAGIINPPPKHGWNDSIGKHSDAQWTKIWQVNVHSHVLAARNLIPEWESGIGDGILVITASAAGILTQIGDVSYGVSKAAAVSVAEHLAISHGGRSNRFPVRVHCLCPQAVETPLIDNFNDVGNPAMVDGIISADSVADSTLQAIREGSFWIFPHTRVQEYLFRKTTDHARWLRGMQKMRQRLSQPNASTGYTTNSVSLSKL